MQSFVQFALITSITIASYVPISPITPEKMLAMDLWSMCVCGANPFLYIATIPFAF